MKRICLILCALVIGTAAQGAEKNMLTPEPERITDEAIAGDIKVIQNLQGRLARLNDKGVPIAGYHFAKAQAWLDFALDEYTINNRSRVVEEALHQALDIIKPLEKGMQQISLDTPIIPTSSLVRPDLWEKAETLKKNADSFRCAGDKIAQLEVQLVWAGHEERELGWRHAKPFLQSAERLAREADARMVDCPPLPPGTVAGAAIPVPAEHAKVKEPHVGTAPASARTDVTTKSTEAAAVSVKCDPTVPAAIVKALEPLPGSIHFAFNKAGISAASADVIRLIAAAMKTEPTLRLILYGHADQRGDLNYNMKLSRQRAKNVRAFIVSTGIGADRITVAPIGKIQPLTKEKSVDAYARNRRVEFFFTFGPVLPVTPQQEDLQPEKRLHR